MKQIENSIKHRSSNAWDMLRKEQSKWLIDLKSHNIINNTEKNKFEKEYASDNLVSSFLEALSPCPERHFSMNKDLTIIKKAVTSIVEAMEENILTSHEANAILEFLATRFIERRLASIMHNVFEIEPSEKHYTFRGIRGSIK